MFVFFPFLLMTSFGAPREPFSFSSPPFICVMEPASPLKPSGVRDFLEKAGPDKIEAVKGLLDSMGFFSPSCDTVKDTIHLRSGARSVVDSLAINARLPCTADSVQKGFFPRPYEAAELAALAEKTLRYFGSKGYPFARLSIAVSEKRNGKSGTSPAGRGAPGGCTVTFSVRENGRYLFSPPLLTGTGKTSERLLLQDIFVKKDSVFDLRKIEDSKIRLRSRRWVSSVETGPFQIVNGTERSRQLSDHSGSVSVPFVISDNVGLGVDGAVAFQAGAAGAGDLTGIFNISLLNLFRHGETGLLTYRGEKEYQRLEVSLDLPYLFNVPLFGSSGFGLEIKENDYGYLHGDLRLTTDFRPFWQWGLAIKGHEVTDSAGRSTRFEGLDFVVSKEKRPYRAGESGSEADFKVGSGIVQYNGRQLNRWHIDLTYGSQASINFRHAAVGRIVFGTVLTGALDTLQTVELYRTGGYNSLRGYSDNEFAFRTVAYGQVEYHFYFNYNGSVFIFMDAGCGFYRDSRVSLPDAEKLFGYGAGIRIPVKIGDASIEWARKYSESSGWGRLHIVIRNNLAAGRS
jgi:hypothetical protein